MKRNQLYFISLLLISTFLGNSKEKIVIGYIPLISQLPLVVQYESERINRHSFEMELAQYRSTTALEAAIRVGAVNVAVLPSPQVISISADEVDVVAIASIAKGGSSLFSHYESIEDFKGKVIGLTGFDSSENFALQKVFANYDLLAGVDFKVIGVSLSTVVEDLSKKTLDGFYLPEPYGTLAKNQELGQFLKIDGLGGLQNDLLVTHRSFLKKNGKIFEEWLKLLKKSIQFINADITNGNSKILSKLQKQYLGIPEDLFLDSINNNIGKISFSFDSVDEDLLNEYYSKTQSLKLITRSLNLDKLVHNKLGSE
ncbi:MAG: ABC transporter substrate-binding protein [Candidatus Cloacimonetes bacterium]|nr:ABC transporter substrate-binding protein [Candidatus Cloacimonadota bacterium]